MTNRLSLALLFLSLTGMTQGEEAPRDGGLTAGYVQDLCSSTKEVKAVACATYLRGVLEGLAYGNMAADGYPSFCLPSKGINAAEARSIFLDAIELEPDRRVDDAAILILTALEISFPCADDEDDTIFGTPVAPELASYRF